MNYNENTLNKCDNVAIGENNAVDVNTTNIYFITINILTQEENETK